MPILGEELTDMYVVTDDKVACLRMPAAALLIKTSHRPIYTEMSKWLQQSIPNKLESYNNYLVERKWTTYKKKLIKEALQQWKAKREQENPTHQIVRR